MRCSRSLPVILLKPGLGGLRGNSAQEEEGHEVLRLLHQWPLFLWLCSAGRYVDRGLSAAAHVARLRRRLHQNGKARPVGRVADCGFAGWPRYRAVLL